jgi:hypothetical protein
MPDVSRSLKEAVLDADAIYQESKKQEIGLRRVEEGKKTRRGTS